jgi:hypothetical protein
MKPPRFTTANMMTVVAIVAFACAAVPFCIVNPVATLTAAALIATAFAVASRGRNKAVRVGAVSLVCCAAVAFAAQEFRSMWRNAERYRMLAKKHAIRRDTLIMTIPYYDRHPERTRCGPWQDERKQWLSFAEYDARLSVKYDRAARFPWLPVEPDPEPPLRSPEPNPLLSEIW